MADRGSDPLADVRTAAAELAGHERAGSSEALRRAEVNLDRAIHVAADAGFEADDIAAAGAPELVAERVREALERERGGGAGGP